ncbi:MAG: response regulator [Halioglobus sp.]
MRVLLVEDDMELRGQLQRQLERLAYQVSLAGDGEEAFYYASEYDIDVAIVDLGLPKMDGIELIQRLRDNGYGFPILVLTARAGWKDKVKGLDAGADDYLTKPFQLEELTARVKALLRRAAGHTSSTLQFGSISLNISTNELSVDGLEVDLTAFEYKVLEHFVMNPGKITTKSMLIDRLYGDNEDRESNVVEVIIARLRKKLDPTGEHRPIETLRGRGYRFVSKRS